MKPYIIKQGRHYASGWLGRLLNIHCNLESIYIDGKFDESCWYEPRNNDDKTDLNKLFGLGFGLSHHKNSVRFGWRPNFREKGKIDIYAYVYDKSSDEHISKYINSVLCDDQFLLIIKLRCDDYLLTVNNKSVEIYNCEQDPCWGFYLYPYFGGNNTAPHDMTILLGIYNKSKYNDAKNINTSSKFVWL